MPERSAAELLYAQLEHDVQECKAAVREWAHEFSVDPRLKTIEGLADNIEGLAERVCLRWWVGRAQGRFQTPDENELRERMMNRTKLLNLCVQTMIKRSGPIDLHAMQISVLGISADVNALWGALIESGMITPAMRQEYLDASVQNTFARVEDYAQKIVTAGVQVGRGN